jgi:hypothetical protein
VAGVALREHNLAASIPRDRVWRPFRLEVSLDIERGLFGRDLDGFAVFGLIGEWAELYGTQQDSRALRLFQMEQPRP